MQWLGQRALLVWAEPKSCGDANPCGVNWVAQWSDEAGRFPEASVLLREVAQPPIRARLNPFSGGVSVLLSISESDGGYAVEAQQIGLTPGQAGTAKIVGRSDRPIPWTNAASTDTGHLVLWATGTNSAEITVQALGPSLNSSSAPAIVTSDVVAWQLALLANRSVLGTVSQDGSVELLSLDATGRVQQRLEVFGPGETNSDIDLVATRGDLLTLTVSRRSMGESRVWVATSDGGSLLSPPAPLTLGAGTESSLGLYSNGESAFALIHQASASPATLQLVAAKPNQPPQHALHMPFLPEQPAPTVSVNDNGIDVLYWGCNVEGGCSRPDQPMLLRSTLALTPTSVYPWKLEERQPDLVWGLTCQKTECRAPTAEFSPNAKAKAPVRVRLVKSDSLRALESMPANVGRQLRSTSYRSVLVPPELAGLDVTESDKGPLLAWLGYFDPNTPYRRLSKRGPDGRFEPLRAALKLRRLPKAGSNQAPLDVTISLRARSRSGLDLATNNEQHLLAWSALHKGIGQVFVTLLNDDGKRIKQRMLTRSRGDVYGVAGAATDDGWWVTWIDDRKQQPRAYAARLTSRLVKRGADIPLPTLSGGKDDGFAATALAAQVRDGTLFVLLTELSRDGRSSRVREASFNEKSRSWQRGPVLNANQRLARGARYARGPRQGRIFWTAESPSGEQRLVYAESGKVGLDSIALFPLEEIRALDAYCGQSRCRVLASGLASGTTPDVSRPWVVQAQVSATPGTLTALNVEKVAALEAPLALSVPVVQHEHAFWFYDTQSTPRVLQGQ